MASSYQIKAAALENLKGSREKIRGHLGNSRVGDRLRGLNDQQAGELANVLLELLDSIDSVISRAKAAD